MSAGESGNSSNHSGMTVCELAPQMNIKSRKTVGGRTFMLLEKPATPE